MSYYVPESASTIEEATQDGLSVVYPERDELLLDFDNSLDYDFFMGTGQGILAQFWGVRKIETAPSASGKPGHLHCRVTLEKSVGPMERFALQAALGSDRKRELLGIAMLNNEDPNPTFLIQKGDDVWKQE
jgi:hypothetical protein